jgi:hypothetical protein
MIDEDLLDLYYNSFITDIKKWLPEGFAEIDLSLLHKYHLLNFGEEGNPPSSRQITRFFHLIESDEKLTLFNDQFIIWIVPAQDEEIPATYTLIALMQGDKLHLEVGFKTKGVYNTSYFLLNFLEHFLDEIQEKATFSEEITLATSHKIIHILLNGVRVRPHFLYIKIFIALFWILF